MLKHHAILFKRLMIITDLCLIASMFFLGYYFRNQDEGMYPLQSYLWILPVFVLTWEILLYSSSMYESFRLKPTSEVIKIIIKSAFISFFIFSTVIYLFKIEYVSRSFIFLIFTLSISVLCLEKILLIQVFRYFRHQGFNFRNIIVVGTGKRAQRFIHRINMNKELGLNIVGIIDNDLKNIGQKILGHKVIGGFDDLPNILKKNAIDKVIFIVPRLWLKKIEDLVKCCETFGVNASVAVDFFDLQFSRESSNSMLGFPFITFETTSDRIFNLLIKRCFDIFVSFLGIIILLPLFSFLAVLIKMNSKGPILFKQVRCGLNGRRFTLYKFRTMVNDAEQRLDSLLKDNEMKGPAFKMCDDPRVTSVGQVLRKLSFDELPQLLNVLFGNMSLVGPRPPISREVKQYDNWQRRRLSMHPGITCLWQVNGRNKIIDFNEWIKLDLKYIDNWSLWLDFRILCKTIPVVLLGTGAK